MGKLFIRTTVATSSGRGMGLVEASLDEIKLAIHDEHGLFTIAESTLNNI